MDVLPACMSVLSMRAWCLQGSEGSIGFLRTRVTDGCELPCRCWESNLGFLEGQPVFLTTEQSQAPCPGLFFTKFISYLGPYPLNSLQCLTMMNFAQASDGCLTLTPDLSEVPYLCCFVHTRYQFWFALLIPSSSMWFESIGSIFDSLASKEESPTSFLLKG